MPSAREDVLREAADATGADAHGRGGEAVDIFPVQEGVLKLLFGEQVVTPIDGGTQRLMARQRRTLTPTKGS